MTVYPGGTRPGTIAVERAVGATTFNQVTTKLSPTGTFTIYNRTGTADVVIDVLGSYGPLATYTYNGDGLRASRSTTTGVQKFAWDPTGSVPLMLTDGTVNFIYDDATVTRRWRPGLRWPWSASAPWILLRGPRNRWTASINT